MDVTHSRGNWDPGEEPSLAARVATAVRSWLPASMDRRLRSVGDDDTSSQRQVSTPPSDEDRVRRLVENRGGRVKQATISATTEWSEAKVSRLLSSMEDAGEIDRYRVGREKVVTLCESAD